MKKNEIEKAINHLMNNKDKYLDITKSLLKIVGIIAGSVMFAISGGYVVEKLEKKRRLREELRKKEIIKEYLQKEKDSIYNEYLKKKLK